MRVIITTVGDRGPNKNGRRKKGEEKRQSQRKARVMSSVQGRACYPSRLIKLWN